MAQTTYETTGRSVSGFSRSKPGSRAWLGFALLVTALDAAATDYRGLAVTFVGIPAFMGFSLLLAVLLMLRPSKLKRAVASIGAVIGTFLAIILIKDAVHTLRYPGGWVPVALLAGLVALSSRLFYKLMRKQAPESAGTPDELP